MECRYCGYILQPFESGCPKCAALAQTRPIALPPPAVVILPPGAAAGFANESCKLCPVCQQPAVLDLAACRRCGALFPGLGAAAPGYGLNSPIPNAAWLPSIERSKTAAARQEKRQVAILAGICLTALFLAVGAAFVLTSRPRPTPGAVETAAQASGSGANMFGAVDSQQMSRRLALEAATTGGDLEFSLAWNTLTDLDLQIRDPSGAEIEASHPNSPSGGVQDVDANPTLLTPLGESKLRMGQIPGNENVMQLPEGFVDMDKKIGLPGGFPGLNIPSDSGKAPGHWTTQPIEHIYFTQAPKGVYTIRASCYSWREPDAQPLPYTIEIRSHGKVIYRYTGKIGPASFVGEGAKPIEVYKYDNL